MQHLTFRYCRGQDIGILPGGWVALGGKEIYWPANVTDQAGTDARSSVPIRKLCLTVPQGIPMYSPMHWGLLWLSRWGHHSGMG